MSKSRLEKFLYALYSLDSSDLPTPLSRIEELYKCLVTGEEAPTFEPLSRVEKYLMAILGVYDVDELPNPISRVEVLLYKLATGDDNLDDVEIFLSEHEELLADIIRNGGAGGNINIEYVLYTLSTEHNTLYNTAEKPVKSAILKGNTLVNINRPITRNDNMKVENGLQILTTWTTAYNIWMVNDITLFKTNTKYYIIAEVIDNTLTSTWSPMIGSIDCVFSGSISSLNFASKETGIKCATFTTKSDFTNVICGLRSETGTNETVGSILKFRIAIIEYQDGMENWDIPYFEGMQSVKMPVLKVTGKNFFDGKLEKGIIDGNNGRPISNDNYVRTVNFIKVQPNMVYTINEKNDSTKFRVYEYDENFNYLKELSTETFTTKSNTSHIKFRTYPKNTGDDVSRLDFEIMLETGNTVTPYEPFKSNILTTSEEVTLRGIGDVQDTLDLMTGEVAQNIGEIVLNGSESWKEYPSQELTNTRLFYCEVPTNSNISKSPVINNRFASLNPNSGGLWDTDVVGLGHGLVNNAFRLRVLKSTANTINELKEYLHSNPIVVQYKLAEKSVKTVDLSTVNQDGNDTKLSTFNDITHVTLSSEGLIPEAELEVDTKNEEDLEVAEKVPEVAASMLTISREQEVIDATTNEQSENVDATMIATTEIYEDLL